MAMLRQGRRNKSNLYVQFGDEPSDDDLSIGYISNPELARWIVAGQGECPGCQPWLSLEDLLIEGRKFDG